MSSTTYSSHSMIENHQGHRFVNEGFNERLILAIGGGALAAFGLSRRSPRGLLLTVLGAGLLHQSFSGHCELYHALGINRATLHGRDWPIARDVHVEEKIIINKSPAELYRFWRNFENLTRFMQHLESVTRVDESRSHWVAKGPAGLQIDWDAEIYNEKENELISWRSLPGSDFVNAGTVHFEPSPDGGGTILTVVMNYNIPGGNITAGLAHLLRMAPEQLLEEDLYRLKQLLETGEIVSDEVQFSGHITDKASRVAAKTEIPRGGTLMGRAHSQVGD